MQQIASVICQFFADREWSLAHYAAAALLVEPRASLSSALRRLRGWRKEWAEAGFFDAGKPSELLKLQAVLEKEVKEGHTPATPVLLLHGVYSTPDIWLPWSSLLKRARDRGEIGHIIGLQLPSSLEERMQLLRVIMPQIRSIYQTVGENSVQIDLVGHSLGGYAAHLAAFETDTIHHRGIERRWHDYSNRNPAVRRAVTIAAPTWLCCVQMGEEHQTRYPHGNNFTSEHIELLQATHEGIFDICARRDLISPPASPLPPHQVFAVNHGHLGLMECPLVGARVIGILAGQSAD
jgi:pimeloyl-ACP methyl ester carboxylesterase